MVSLVAVKVEGSNAFRAVEKPPPKPRGHRRKDPNTEVMTDKAPCKDCGNVLSKYSLRYSHKCPAKKKQIVVEDIAVNPPAPTPQAQPQEQPQAQPKQNRRMLDLDNLDPTHADVHNVVHRYITHLHDSYKQEKQSKYRTMLSGRI